MARRKPEIDTGQAVAGIALASGGALVALAVERTLEGSNPAPAEVSRSRSITRAVIGTALTRIATRSVPGAIVVGGALLAKTLQDRRKAKAARFPED